MRISDWSSDVCSSDLQGPRRRYVGNPQLVARMRPKRIARHELIGNRERKFGLQTTRRIDVRQFLPLESRLRGKFGLFAGQVGLFGIGLRTDRDIFPGSHRPENGSARWRERGGQNV